MHSVLFEVGPLTIHWYGVMMAVGFVAALTSWILLGRTCGRDAQSCSDLLFWVMLSGILGARLAYVAEHWSEYAAEPLTILRVNEGGLIFYGGLIAAGAVILLYARRRREPALPLVDFSLTAVPLAHAFGRIGCFLHGCCFGKCTELPIGVQFPQGSASWITHYHAGMIDKMAPLSRSIHPVQLYEAGYNVIIYTILIWTFRRSKRAGTVSGVYMVLYSLGRFVLEFFRGDRGERWEVLGLSVGQAVSIPILLLGVALILGAHFWKCSLGQSDGQ
ncbi:MAG: prolipoprotein diacylglyceryl transferase [Verrucomicrobia bacterium]|jgi:phosphatidylglycerol---prolipoprotein diacylglyceryl transferase|nr:prolipoprotein diacylglyceryl transferase [Verrucomicrobiota bacterium]